MTPGPQPRVLLFAPDADFADAAARLLVERYSAGLPDLSRLTLLVPNAVLAARLAERLALHAGGAVLGPRIFTLPAFARQSAVPWLPALHCRLRLAEALSRYRGLFPGQDHRRLADALFKLFEEFTLAQADLPVDEAAFEQRLREAYAAPQLAALSREAQIVHRLRQAYQEEIGDRAPAAAYLRGLRDALAQSTQADDANAPSNGLSNGSSNRLIYWLGFDALHGAERRLLQVELANGRAELWTQGRIAGRDGAALRELIEQLAMPFVVLESAPGISSGASTVRTELLDAAFADDVQSAHLRAATLRKRRLAGASPAAQSIRLVAAADAEHEARCVDLVAREALLGGAAHVAVVSGDRRLARRLRALLERAGIALDDRVGWSLATSRAAAALDAWLGCLESDFHYQPLLDLPRSGFFAADDTHDASMLADTLARDYVYARHGSVHVGLAAWQRAVRRDARLQPLFERLAASASDLPLRGEARAGTGWSDALQASITRLGLAAGLQHDEAGARLCEALEQLRAALAGLSQRLEWNDFRRLLDRQFEETLFRPTNADTLDRRVTLHTLDQCQGLRADCLILGAATAAQLPGAAPGDAFFNAAVRAELGLAGWPQQRAQSLARLRALLEAAPQVWITAAPAEAGETVAFSPWIESLRAFAQSSGCAIEDEELAHRAGRAQTEIAVSAPSALPATRAAPAAVPTLLDFGLSAGAHQSLLDCPYQFHVRSALGLFAPQPPDAPAGRNDFGDRVHRILRAFYAADAELPAPWAGPLDMAHLAEVECKLLDLGSAAFGADVAARPLAGAWTREFAALVPWLAARLVERGSAGVRVEFEQESELAGWRLQGKVDRLEHFGDADADSVVVDYKTGAVAKVADVLAGEKVQLPHYALMLGARRGVEYWNLKEQKLVGVDGEALVDLLPAIEQRLQRLSQALHAGHALAASGAPEVCRYCDYAGLCRHDAVLPAVTP